MANQEIKQFKPLNGQWALVNGQLMWEELISRVGEPRKVEHHEPQELGLRKIVTFSIVTSKEFPTVETLTSTGLVYFVQHLKVAVREDAKDVWLLMQDGKIFMKNLRLGTTSVCDLRTNPWCIVTKTEFTKTSLEQIRELEKKRLVLAFHKFDPQTGVYGLSVK